jgi:hypothetical protein
MPGLTARLAVRRGCGYRVRGGVYVESDGPVETSLVEPPVELTPGEQQRLGLAAIGTRRIMRDGVVHLLDWIGEGHYPSVRTFLDEARQLGVSRRVSSLVDLSGLTASSRLLCVHRLAVPGGAGYPAIFAAFPIHRVVVVADEHGRAEQHRRRLVRAGIHATIVEV